MRILIIEDEPDLLQNLAQGIRENGFAVDTAKDGEEGLYKAETWAYDALVLDITLPRLDGLTLLERLRRTQKTPVILLTARDSIRDRVRGLDHGADDYLTKPFDFDELLARLRALIRRAADSPNPIIELDSVSVNTALRRVEKDGQTVALTNREYTLLEYLVQHRNEVVSRTELYEHLFDESDTSLSNLLDVHISNLRKKLGNALITTRRGQGYCIEL